MWGGGRPCAEEDDSYYFDDGNKAEADILFPLSVQVWGKEIGVVSFMGSHPTLCPFYNDDDHPAVYADPFEVALVFDPDSEGLGGLRFGTDRSEQADNTHDSSTGSLRSCLLPFLSTFLKYARNRLIISVTDDYKAECSFYEQIPNTYGMRLPNPGVDAKLEGIWYDTTFVGYLRKNFQWGGFPGWERYSSRPEKELEYLREGLLPI